MFWQDVAFAMGQPAGGGGAEGNPLVAFLPLIILFVIFYFLLIRPQQKRAKQHREMLDALQKGDSVITAGGLYGRIKNLSEDAITLDLGNNMEVKVNRAYVSMKVDKKTGESSSQS
ncbi:MAG: preprotein translocase subunit YajC [Desulfohalobiaceae bacterium]